MRNLNILQLYIKIVTNNHDVSNILHKIYDKNSLVDYELLAYALNNIVYDALYNKINVYWKTYYSILKIIFCCL